MVELKLSKLKANLNKIKFAFNLYPYIQRSFEDYRRYIPQPYNAVCLISADFEMAWASRYTKSVANPLTKAIEDGLRTRRNVPIILDLCDRFNIPITWATVGHLFLESCSAIEGVKHHDLPRLPHFENEYWKFDKGDWFDCDPCSDYSADPAWYAPDLIRYILSREVKHEIGCHTFSHIDCRDSIDDGTVFQAELEKCIEIAAKWGLELKSFVHPGHTIGHLDKLAQLGLTSIRTDYGDTLAFPVKHISGIWELKNTSEFSYRPSWSIDYHIERYKSIIDRAIKHKRVCVLWFHPSLPELFVDKIVPPVLGYLAKKRDEILSMTHSGYIGFLES